MAREFDPYNPAVPLGVTWEETISLDDENGEAIDLTGYEVRAQFYVNAPTRNVGTGLPVVPPVAEIVSAGAYPHPPVWPTIIGATIPDPTNGTILIKVGVADLWQFAPDNARQRYVWSLVLVNPQTGYAIPVVSGRAAFTPAVTM